MKVLTWMVAGLALTACADVEDTETVEGGLETMDLEELASALSIPSNVWLPDELGAQATASANGDLSFRGDFFKSLGSNGRTCASCHAIAEGWTVTPLGLQLRFLLTAGKDPVFRPNDGAVSPTADVSTLKARKAAYQMLLDHGLIRVGIGVPAGAEFELVSVDDPHGYASAQELSLFRRPLPATNLGLLSTVMWDGRETQPDIIAALGHQANGATIGHAQARQAPTQAQIDNIVDFEAALTSTQVYTFGVGRLDAKGAAGSPEALATQPMVRAPWTVFDAWAAEPATSARAAVYRGQVLFNTAPDRAGGTCANCHDIQNAGGRLDGRFFSISTSKPAHRMPGMPLYTFRRLSTGELRETTDPGRALITGKWTDMDRFKVPTIRNLGARAPYFHNGIAKTLDQLVRHYELEFGFVFTDAQRADLVAFLSAL